jgi:hypothetical protein
VGLHVLSPVFEHSGKIDHWYLLNVSNRSDCGMQPRLHHCPTPPHFASKCSFVVRSHLLAHARSDAEIPQPHLPPSLVEDCTGDRIRALWF